MRKKKNGRGRSKVVQVSKKSKKEPELPMKIMDNGSPIPDVSVLGYTKTGPTSYRVGSTHVRLDGSEEEIQPIFKDSEIVLEVECGSNSALMYLSRLCQGSKGLCIEFEGSWMSPNDFQMLSGRETAKDWKRSIRHYGRSLKLLINKGILTIHPGACRCDSCRLLTQTTACEPPKPIDRKSKEAKKQQDFGSVGDEIEQEDYTSSPENSLEADSKEETKTNFGFESEGSKAETDSSEPNSPNSSVTEDEPLAGLVSTDSKLFQSSDNCEINDSNDCELGTTTDFKDSETCQLNNNNTKFSLNNTESKLEIKLPFNKEELAEESADEQQSDSLDDEPLSVLKQSTVGTDRLISPVCDVPQSLDDQYSADSPRDDDIVPDSINSDKTVKEQFYPEAPTVRSPVKQHGHRREARLSNIINHLRTSKEKLSPLENKHQKMNEGQLDQIDVDSHELDKASSKDTHTPDRTSEDAASGNKDIEMGEIIRNHGIDSAMPPSSLPQPLVPPPYFGVPFDPQYPMLGLSLQHLFAQNIANMNGVAYPPGPFPDIPNKLKHSSVKMPAATMTKEEYHKQKLTIPIPTTPLPNSTSSPEGSASSRGSLPPSQTSPTYSAEKAAVMAKLTEKLAKISEKPPEVIDKTVKSVIKRAKRMQKLEKLQAKLKKTDFVSPISGKSNKEYYRDRSPERQPQRYGDPSIRADKKQIPATPPPAHQNVKLGNQPTFLPSPGLSLGYPYCADSTPLQIPIPSLQMWQSCFPFTVPPPGLETTRFTQFFHNLNGAFMGNPMLKRPAEETVVDLSSKRRRYNVHRDSGSYRDSASEHFVTSLHTSPRLNNLPTTAPSPNNISTSPESSSSPFLCSAPQLNSENSPPSTVFSEISSLAGKESMKRQSSETEHVESCNFIQNGSQTPKLNGLNSNNWSDYECKCTCDYKNIDDIRLWNNEDVCSFMKKLDGCAPYIETFRRAGVDGSSLPLLTTDSLTKSLGMKLGPALVLTGAVARKAREISKIVPCSYCRQRIQRG